MSDLNTRIVALREKSAKAFADAKSIQAEFAKYDGDVPSDKLASFNAAIEDSTAALAQAQELESQADKFSALNEAHNRPVNALPTAGRETQADARGAARREAHKKSFASWLGGDVEGSRETLMAAGYSRGEAHALIAGDDTKGGYLVPDDFRAEVIRREAEIAGLRTIVRVIPTSRDVLVMPRIAANAGTYPKAYSSGFTGDWDTEQGSTTESSGTVTVKTQQSQPTFEMVRINVHNWIPNPVIASMSLLDDAAAPLEQILAEEIAMTKASDEDLAIIRGTGVNEPSGFLVDSRLATASGNTARVAAGSSSVSYAGLLDLVHSVPGTYARNGRLIMRRATLGNILALETGTGVSLVFGQGQSGPNNLLGYPVVFSEFMDAEGSAKYPVAFGDFSRGYVIADRKDLRIQRLVERYAPNIGFAPVCRLGGSVVLPEAIRLGYTS